MSRHRDRMIAKRQAEFAEQPMLSLAMRQHWVEIRQSKLLQRMQGLSRPYHYILQGRLAVPCDDIVEWGRWFGSHDRRVAGGQIGPYRISTVFLGLDHNFGGGGEPLLFETMVFRDEEWGDPVAFLADPDDPHSLTDMLRASNWGDAEVNHRIASQYVLTLVEPPRQPGHFDA